MNAIKVAHVYDSQCGRNDGAPLYTLEALKKTEGVLVDHYLPIGDPYKWGNYDLFWWVDFADDALGYQDFPCPQPNFYWCSDYHISKESYDYRLKRAKDFDLIGCYQKRNVEEFIKEGIPKNRIFWLPCAFEPTCYRPGVFDLKKWDSDGDQVPVGKRGWIDAVPLKKYDLGFVGHINNPKRLDALDKIFEAIPNFFYGTKRFEKCSSIYNQSKVVFNIAHADDINMRVFEVMGSGAFLLTENIPTIHELFEDGKHLVTYDNIDDAIEKARYYIEHDEEREKIAKEGYEEVISKHTYQDRVNTVLEKFKTLKQEAVCI